MRNKDIITLKWIYRVCGSAIWWTILLTLIRFLQGGICIAYAYGLKRVVDCAQAGLGAAFYRQLGLFVGLVVITLALQALGRYVLEKSKANLDKAFRMHTFTRLLSRDYAKVTGTHTGEWMNRLTSDTSVVSTAVATILPEVTGSVTRILGALVSLLGIAPKIVYILLPCGLAMMLFSYVVRKWLKRYHKQMQEADGKARSFMQERLYSLLVVRTFTQETATAQMAAAHMDDWVCARMRRLHLANLSQSLLAAAVHGAQVLGIGVCGWGILNGIMSYGTMSSTLYLINQFETPFAAISGYLSRYYAMLASAERLMEVDALTPDSVCTPLDGQTVRKYYEDAFGSLGLEHTSFAYEDGQEHMVLEDFSLDIRKGEFVAFTGESGCGKSTVLKVLLNLYPLQKGELYLQDGDGSYRTLDAGWRGLFAYVPQGNQLLSGTIRETITFWDSDLMTQEARIYEALRVACAEDFVKELPKGLDTVLGERGSGLSEGQMQRLSVARAVLSGRPILLLDEATSALDGATEEQLLKNLRAMTDRTVLIVTHREAALEFCDKQIHFGANE